MRERTGKCERCRNRYVWRGNPPLHSAYCTYCRVTGDLVPLYRTSHLLRWPLRPECPLWGPRHD